MPTVLRTVADIRGYDTEDIETDEYWNMGDQKEQRIHNVHAYPAKFPAFIATKSINYAFENGLNVQRIADIFCGCGTVAVEAKANNIEFWGCDINPVATLIASVKSRDYNLKKMNDYYDRIIKYCDENNTVVFSLAWVF